MKSKCFSSIVAVTLTATVIGLTVIGTSNSNKTFFASASKDSYGISFNSSKNKFHSYTGNTAYDGDATIKTNLGNDIDFSYYQVKGIASTWHVLGSGGYFYNTDPIHGIEKITLTFKTDNALFDIYYSIDDSFDQKQSFTSSVESPTVFNFDDYLPYYFKIVNNSGSNFNISSVDIALSCQLNYQTLTITNENEVMGSVSGSGIKAVGENVTITATPNPGYRFSGWYNGSKLVSSNNPYTFNMPYSDITYIAKFSTNSYELTLNNNNHDLGSITGSGSFLYGSNVTIIATPNTGVSFLGWYDNEDNLISSLLTYTFTMPYEDLEYTAKFAWTPYFITIDVNESTMGSVTGSGSYTYGQQVNLVATPNEHHSFFGWYLDDELISREPVLTFSMPDESLDYEARFVVNHYIYVYSDDESMGTVNAPIECGTGLNATVIANASTGYAIDYWYDDDLNEVSYESEYTFAMPNHDVTLYAAFATGYTLTISSSDISKGTVTGGGQYKAGRSVTVTMTYISGTFKGWYDSDNNLVSSNNPYTFTMPSSDYLLAATFMTTEEWNIAHGVVPTISEDGKTITYGLYPQTNVEDAASIASLNELAAPESNGWYLYNNEYYAKLSATPYKTNCKFDNGTTIVSGTTYWFKCEPITWNVLSNNSGEYYLVSSVLLDTHCYYNDAYSNRTIGDQTVYPNNYEYSDIRAWLNNDFYDSAFALGNNYIQTTTVKNSASTTNSSSNTYVCNNTQDKVFLPSYKDYINFSYGFTTSTDSTDTRYCKTTDWARARGSYYYHDTIDKPTNYNGYYWTRSPYNAGDFFTWMVGDYGCLVGNQCRIDDTDTSVRPAITLKIT